MAIKRETDLLSRWSERRDLKEFAEQVEAWQAANDSHPVFSIGEYPELTTEDILAGKEAVGMKYTVRFQNGQVLGIIAFQDGHMERFYSDNGDIPITTVTKTLVGWQTLFKQAQRGGRPKGSGKPKDDPVDLLRQLAKSGLSEREFEREYGKSRSTIRRAKRRKLDSDNR
jgi:hypothetical protein